MIRILLIFGVASVLAIEPCCFADDANDATHSFTDADWPWWRGPQRNGIADPNQTPPTKWSADENIAWKSSIPGRGHGSITVVGDQVLAAFADHDREVQGVMCFDRKSGKPVWTADVHKGGFSTKGNKKASLASSTVACDGERLFINFLNAGAVHLTALDRSGKKLWQTKICDYVVHQGFGSSPAIYKSLVIASADNKGSGAIVAMKRASGEIVWKRERPKTPNYASPTILHAAGRDQLVFTGCNLVTSLNPMTGEPFWEIKGSTTECVTSTVTDGTRVFTSGGYPKNHVSAVNADGSGKVAWSNPTRVYVPSMLSRDGYLYAVADAAMAVCWKSDTGEEVWKQRISGKAFTASPVLVGDLVFVTSETGQTIIFKSNPEKFELVAENQLGDEVLATPTICGSRIYMRIAERVEGTRLESLVCISKVAE
ncbi:MAG: PQQ-binding-like beta-propeller repeat protein [Planctomycetota bacterium]|nr:PQQ-binding-like beta-propeller repeat protein [Planctomycetota bacterium]